MVHWCKKSGNVKIYFAGECLEVMVRNGITVACIYAAKNQYGNMTIYTVGTVPADVLQQLRDLWLVY